MTKMTTSVRSPQLRLTLRDVAILEDIYTSRYMTAPQIQALHWRENRGGQFGQLKCCQRRLRLLHEAHLLRRVEPLIHYTEGKKPFIYALDKAGAQVLTNELGIDPATIDYKPQSAEENYPFLQHILDTTDLRIAFTNATESAGVQLKIWRNERELKSEGMSDIVFLTDPDGKQHKAAVVPDAVACLARGDKQAVYHIELDRRTVTVDPTKWEKRGWMRKIRAYSAFFMADCYKQRYGDHIVQVLVVVVGGEKRLAHLKEATEAAGGGKRFWFTTQVETQQYNVMTAKIWQRAGMDGLYALLPK